MRLTVGRELQQEHWKLMSLDSRASVSHDTCPQNSRAASLLIILANATLTMLPRGTQTGH